MASVRRLVISASVFRFAADRAAAVGAGYALRGTFRTPQQP
jgi:hypothetical protein